MVTIFKINSINFRFFFVFICRPSRICSRRLFISCAIIVVFSIRIFRNLENCQKLFENTLYICKQPLMIAYVMSECARDNFGKFIHQFQPETKTLTRKFERILIQLYRQNESLLFNQTSINERLLPNNNTHTHTHTLSHILSLSLSHTHTHTHTHTYIYIYIYIINFCNYSIILMV